MSVEIKLREKYRKVTRGRFKSSHNDQGHKKRTKIGREKHEARYGVPPVRVMVLQVNGKVRMIDAADL